jgi:hypothetical protein
MFGIADRLNQVEKLLKTNPQAALAILNEDVGEVTKELECISKLGRELSEIREKIGHASFVLRTRGKDFGREMADKEITATISRDTKDAVGRIKTSVKLFSELKNHMKKLEE